METTSTIMPITTRSSMSVKARRGLWINVAEATDVIVGSISSVPACGDQDVAILLAGNIGRCRTLEIGKRVVGVLAVVGVALIQDTRRIHCLQAVCGKCYRCTDVL